MKKWIYITYFRRFYVLFHHAKLNKGKGQSYPKLNLEHACRHVSVPCWYLDSVCGGVIWGLYSTVEIYREDIGVLEIMAKKMDAITSVGG